MYLYFYPMKFISIVEPSEVLELSQKLDWRLCSIRFQFGHVQVIHKDNHLLSLRGSW